ncbi:L-serine ammonia-lyase, iron-sulfur-dependent subunit beta [Sporosalibacterium faouarense]|uniref:L-serine ammonia-lyase, iron-sulfur-dependent subunit beta n=1 Tax=Sporosalibacterium faouarense TaxID=516123 RepID=UPI00141C68A2|nr:L-serine ammonia-lyase, iron-sulfur-dependent subunit beta [Sporosalibacterium faouarense]MTI47580.1 L-serine ammonia-lyase, iron-sulfur-dependent, subunit beta [Bacillota bacterium]
MNTYSSFQIIGPKMIGPSSSHTAGAARLGKIVSKLIKGEIKSVKFLLHGSFAKTYKGHGTDRALMAGLLGMKEDDENLRHSLEIAESKGIKYEFIETDLKEVHPNTVKFIVTQENDELVELMGSSIGGGNVKVIEINGMKLEFVGQYPTLITRHLDSPGVVARITKILSEHNINIAFMSVYRQDKGRDALMVIESDDKLEQELVGAIKDSTNNIKEVYIIDSL